MKNDRNPLGPPPAPPSAARDGRAAELQSVVRQLEKELRATRDELRRKTDELDAVHTDLQNLIQSSRIPTLFLDRELRLRKFTPAMEQLAHLRDEDLGKPLSLVAPDLALPHLRRAADEIIRTLTPHEEQLWLEGRRAWYIARVLPYLTLDQAVLGVVMTFTDITECKHAELTSRLLAAIVESSDDAIVSKDLQGRITSWNQGAERIFGYSAAEMIGRPITTIIPPDRQLEEPMILDRIHRGERVTHYETIRQRKDGRLIEVSLTVSPVKDAQGRITGASKIARDITERKQSERALAEARENLAQANQDLERRVRQRTQELADSNSQLESLVYSIAHDLRAPLRSMQSYATILREDYGKHLDETGRGYLDRIGRSAEFLDRLILDLLAYGRLGQTAIELSTVDLNACWTAALEQNEELAARQRAVVEAAAGLTFVRAHETTLTQVLANLLNNALRFVPPERTPHVRLRTENIRGIIRIWVEDNGIGIEPKYHERIFRVFQQLNGKQYGGTGVGLAIVRRGIERMGGRVGLESVVGQGTRFWLELPAA